MFLNITTNPEIIEKYVTPLEIALSEISKNSKEDTFNPTATGIARYKNKII